MGIYTELFFVFGILFQFILLIHGRESMSRVTLSFGTSHYLTHQDRAVFLVDLPSKAVLGDSHWTLKHIESNRYTLHPSNAPHRFLATDLTSVMLVSKSKTHGVTWRLQKVAGDTGYMLESADYDGYYLDAEKSTLVMNRDFGSVQSIYLGYGNRMAGLIANLDFLSGMTIKVQGLSLAFLKDNGERVEEKSYLIDMDPLSQNAYRLRSASNPLLCVSLDSSNMLVLMKFTRKRGYVKCLSLIFHALSVESTQEEESDHLLLKVAIVSSVYEGNVVFLENDRVVLKKAIDGLDSATTFQVDLDLEKVEYVLASDLPLQVSLKTIEKEETDETKLYFHHVGKAIQVNSISHTLLSLYDASFVLEKASLNTVEMRPLNHPSMRVCISESDYETEHVKLALSEQIDELCLWKLDLVEGNKIQMRSFADPDWSIGVVSSVAVLASNQVTENQRSTTKRSSNVPPTQFEITASVITQSSVFLLPVHHEEWIGKSVMFRNFKSRESLSLSFSKTFVVDWRFKINVSNNQMENYFSFESVMHPGFFLVHDRFGLEVRQKPNDDSDPSEEALVSFSDDSSWRLYSPFVHVEEEAVMIESSNYPGMFVSNQQTLISAPQTAHYDEAWDKLVFIIDHEKEWNASSPGSQRRKRMYFKTDDL